MRTTSCRSLLGAAVASFLFLSACYNPFSSPSGYTLATRYRTLSGLESGIGARVGTEIVLPYQGATGSRSNWTADTFNLFFRANSPGDVILPGDWAFHWQTPPCAGQSAIGEVQRYMVRTALCQEVISRNAQIFPGTVDYNSPPAAIDVSGTGFEGTYGAPVAYLFDFEGRAQDVATANYVASDGSYLQFPTSAVTGLYNGYYTVMFYNKTSDGGLVFVGWGEIELINAPQKPTRSTSSTGMSTRNGLRVGQPHSAPA